MAEKISNPKHTCPTTIWTEVSKAGMTEKSCSQSALESLLQRYYLPLKLHLLYKFKATEADVEDWLHSFVWKKVLRDHLIRRARKDKGKFRTFLLNALDNFVLSQIRHDRAQSRRPQGGLTPLDEAAEFATMAAGQADPFDLAWARAVIEETICRLQRECQAKDREDRWQVFKRRVLDPMLGNAPPEPYQNLVAQLGFRSPSEASSALIAAKRSFDRNLRAVVGEYTSDTSEIELELRQLKQTLSQG